MAATSQDYMCESFILEKTGLTIPEHQRLTIKRYDALLSCQTGVYILPVLQGYQPAEYVEHLGSTAIVCQLGCGSGLGVPVSATASPSRWRRCSWQSGELAQICGCMALVLNR